MNEDEILTELSETVESVEEKAVETEETAEEAFSAIGEKEAEELTAHPMFSRFARGRQGSFEEILMAFREMLAVSPSQARETVSAKMTPAASQTTLDVALTERQRAIARAAGMTYREYYAILNK